MLLQDRDVVNKLPLLSLKAEDEPASTERVDVALRASNAKLEELLELMHETPPAKDYVLSSHLKDVVANGLVVTDDGLEINPEYKDPIDGPHSIEKPIDSDQLDKHSLAKFFVNSAKVIKGLDRFRTGMRNFLVRSFEKLSISAHEPVPFELINSFSR